MLVKPIPGYPGYFASDQGEIYSNVRRGRPSSARLAQDEPLRRISSQISSVRNYRRMVATLGRGRYRKVAYLVALAFVGERPTPSHELAHLDGDSLNNRPNNLAWKTRIENERDKVAHGTSNRGERQGASKLKESDVRAIRTDPRKQRDIAIDYGISQGHVSMIKSRSHWGWLPD
jgi:HNH endonuclease